MAAEWGSRRSAEEGAGWYHFSFLLKHFPAPPKTPELFTSLTGLGFGVLLLIPRFPGVLLVLYTFIIIIILLLLRRCKSDIAWGVGFVSLLFMFLQRPFCPL